MTIDRLIRRLERLTGCDVSLGHADGGDGGDWVVEIDVTPRWPREFVQVAQGSTRTEAVHRAIEAAELGVLDDEFIATAQARSRDEARRKALEDAPLTTWEY